MTKRSLPKNISQYEVSQAARHAVAFTGNVSYPEIPTVLSQGKFALVLCETFFWLKSLLTLPMHRAGVLANMTMKEFRRIRKIGEQHTF